MISATEHPCRIFSLAEIQSASKNFDDDLVIGEGGFGKVYKGRISTEDVVAIKRLDSMSNQGEVEFRAEIDMLTKLGHCNLVSLIGYCNDNKEMILVYDYMPNGTLYHHLHKGETVLSWVRRLKIAIGAARGLDYLHTGVGTYHGVIHRDMKTSNILLDKNWDAMISDFGLSKISPTNQLISYVDASVKGTFGYLDPIYFYTKKLTRKTDVYAFGVVLFELLSGRLPVDERYEDEECSLVLWAEKCVKERKFNQMVDPIIKGTIFSKCLKRFALIAYRCVHSVPKERPTMTELVASLQALLELQEKSNYYNQSSASTVGFKWKIRKYFAPTTKPNSAEEDLEVHLGKLQKFSLHELQIATDNFNSRHILRWGGFGKVYEGRVADGTLVAIKRLKEERIQVVELQFQAEVKMISMAGHRNLLRLKGFCKTPTERLLVYPFMANGSVVSCLRGRPDKQPLDWPIRKRIALGSARGFAHLHDQCDLKIICRDVKAANILLDEEFEAVIGDFELAKFMDHKDTHVTTVVRSTMGHIAPEYLSTGKCSEKTDVFGYGVMLLELFTGQKAFDLARLANDDDVMLLDWVTGLMRENKMETLVDANLKGNYIDDEVEQLFKVVCLCTQRTPSERPKMSEVVRMLEGDGLAEKWERMAELGDV